MKVVVVNDVTNTGTYTLMCKDDEVGLAIEHVSDAIKDGVHGYRNPSTIVITFSEMTEEEYDALPTDAEVE
jgi:hypothetical protein